MQSIGYLYRENKTTTALLYHIKSRNCRPHKEKWDNTAPGKNTENSLSRPRFLKQEQALIINGMAEKTNLIKICLFKDKIKRKIPLIKIRYKNI